MKIFSIFQLFVAGMCFQFTSCGYPETSMVRLKGPNDKVELVFFYKKGASYEEKQTFENNVLHTPSLIGNAFPEGVSGQFAVRNSDYEGYAIEFYLNATPNQREQLRKSIESSPVVYKVFENVVPNEVKLP